MLAVYIGIFLLLTRVRVNTQKTAKHSETWRNTAKHGEIRRNTTKHTEIRRNMTKHDEIHHKLTQPTMRYKQRNSVRTF